MRVLLLWLRDLFDLHQPAHNFRFCFWNCQEQLLLKCWHCSTLVLPSGGPSCIVCRLPFRGSSVKLDCANRSANGAANGVRHHEDARLDSKNLVKNLTNNSEATIRALHLFPVWVHSSTSGTFCLSCCFLSPTMVQIGFNACGNVSELWSMNRIYIFLI
jgi:hypothetical protein